MPSEAWRRLMLAIRENAPIITMMSGFSAALFITGGEFRRARDDIRLLQEELAHEKALRREALEHATLMRRLEIEAMSNRIRAEYATKLLDLAYNRDFKPWREFVSQERIARAKLNASRQESTGSGSKAEDEIDKAADDPDDE